MPSSQRDDFPRGGLALLDAAFHPLHAAIILLSTLGWVFPPTRGIGLAIQVLVLFSWFGLGWFRGFGYCLATDWHTRIQLRRGKQGFPHGYIRFLCERRSEEHTSELQSPCNVVCRLLLEKKTRCSPAQSSR